MASAGPWQAREWAVATGTGVGARTLRTAASQRWVEARTAWACDGGGREEVGVAVEFGDDAVHGLGAAVVLEEEVDLGSVLAPAAFGGEHRGTRRSEHVVEGSRPGGSERTEAVEDAEAMQER
jgi:hypothetical protein